MVEISNKEVEISNKKGVPYYVNLCNSWLKI
jgi:hypothetical protein